MFSMQCRMARAALGLGVRELAAMTGMSTQTISRLEAGQELRQATIAAIRATLEQQGVTFIDQTKDHGPGVMLSRPIE